MRYVIGLDKLQSAEEQVAGMQVELRELQPKLVQASEECANMLQVIERERIEVEKVATVVRADEEVANKQAADAQAIRDECDSELSQAIPILNSALAALDTLTPQVFLFDYYFCAIQHCLCANFKMFSKFFNCFQHVDATSNII